MGSETEPTIDATVHNDDAARALARHLGMLRHPDGKYLALVSYRHESPHTSRIKHRIAEALVECLRTNGYAITKAEPNERLETK